MFLDLAKFYEMVGHDSFLQEAEAVGFNIHLAACLMASWGAWRYMEYDGALSLRCNVPPPVPLSCVVPKANVDFLMYMPCNYKELQN